MFSKLHKDKKGFTIIEVLIVLAIAGLILLIVFLAVPALQRNGRNTQRRNDVAALLGAVSEFTNNNNGVLPTAMPATGIAGTVRFGCATPPCTTADANVGYYNRGIGTGVGQVQLLTAFAATGPFTTAANDRVVIVPVASCSTTTVGQAVGGSARQFVAIFEIENAVGANPYAGACQES